MVTRCLPSCCAAGGTMASAAPFCTSFSAGGARRASGTRWCPSSLCVLAVPASAPRCSVPLAADNGAPPTNAPLRAFLLGARVAQVSAAPPSIYRRAPAFASANACRRRSSLPALVAYHTGGSHPRPILRGADPCPACATAPPSLCQAAFAQVCLERPCLVSLAPGERDPPSVIAANVSSPPPGKFPETTPTPSLVTAPSSIFRRAEHACVATVSAILVSSARSLSQPRVSVCASNVRGVTWSLARRFFFSTVSFKGDSIRAEGRPVWRSLQGSSSFT
ncbi:unnamed protein product [Closterium sp. NIES-65]|nr:unnamed protein product [Closterium sp. NIES-65]